MMRSLLIFFVGVALGCGTTEVFFSWRRQVSMDGFIFYGGLFLVCVAGTVVFMFGATACR